MPTNFMLEHREGAKPPTLPANLRAYTDARILSYGGRVGLYGNRWNPDEWIQREGYAKLDKMITLAAYRAPLWVKKGATLYKPAKVLTAVRKPDDPDYDKAAEIAEFCEYALNSIYDSETTERQSKEALLWSLLDAVHRGHSVLSLEYRTFEQGKWAGKWGLKRFVSLHPDNLSFWLNPYNLRVELTYYRGGDGGYYALPNERCLRYTYNPADSLPFGDGDGRGCYKHAFYILEGLRYFGLDVERWAAGNFVAQTNNTSEDYMNKLMDLMSNVRQGTDAVFPKDIDLTVLTRNVSSHNVFQNFFLEHQNAIVRLVLGQSLTTGVQDGKGSYALGDIQADTQEIIFSIVRNGLEQLMRYQLFARLVRWNFGAEYLPLTPFFSLGTWNTKERQAMANFYSTYKQFGSLEPTEEWIRDEFGLPPQGTALISGE